MPTIRKENNVLIYKGSNSLRQRLLLSVLSAKPVRIVEIRTLDDDPGLKEYEISFIRLLDKLTNGTNIELNETGTCLSFFPGILTGGTFDHNCSLQRGIGYYLEVLLMLGLFCKTPIKVTLRGITSNSLDPSVDHIKASVLPVLKRFIMDDEGLDIQIRMRGMLPLGGGEVIFQCPIKKQLRPIQLLDFGMVKRIRGTAYALRVSPALANRMVTAAKGILLNFIPDVYINTNQSKGKYSGKSPGFGIHLVAETTNGVFYSAEQLSNVVSNGEEPSVPEDVGTSVANRLLEEIYLGGCTDSTSQTLGALFMALGPKDVSKLLVGPLSEYTISFLQHLKEFFGVTFKLEYFSSGEEEEEVIAGAPKVLLTCVGVGFTNLSKRTL